MPTILIQIDKKKGKGYPTRILVDHVEKAKGTIPVSLKAGPRIWAAADIASVITASRSGLNLADLGKYLFALLEVGGVAKEWVTARNAPSDAVHTILDIAPRELQLMPWEVLFVGARHAALQAEEPLYRAAPSKFHHVHGDELPLRILAVAGAADNDAAIGWREEVEGLRVLFRANPEAVDLEVLIRPDRQELVALYKMFRPHIVHFIGHGGTSPSGETGLQFWDGQNGRWWTVTQIVQDLGTKHWRPRLVFLNACRTADAGAQDSAHDITRAVVSDAGACCAIGMQADVPGTDAARFAKIVYGELAAGRHVDDAVTAARIEIEGSCDIWPLPLLQVACAPEVALPAQFPASADVDNLRIRFRKRLSTFSDRQDVRRRFWSDIAATPPAKNLVLVHGKGSFGKTALMLWCVRHFALRGEHQVRYVNVAAAEKRDYDGFLSLLRNGDGTDWPIEGKLPEAHFEAYDKRLANPIPSSDAESELTGLFCTGLAKYSKEKPLLFVLDQFEFVGDPPFAAVVKNYVLREFVERVRNGVAGDVRLVLVVRQAEYDSPELADLRVLAHRVEVTPWERKHFRLVADEVFAYARSKKAKFVDKLIDAAEESLDGPTWTPDKLNQAIDYARAVGAFDD